MQTTICCFIFEAVLSTRLSQSHRNIVESFEYHKQVALQLTRLKLDQSKMEALLLIAVIASNMSITFSLSFDYLPVSFVFFLFSFCFPFFMTIFRHNKGMAAIKNRQLYVCALIIVSYIFFFFSYGGHITNMAMHRSHINKHRTPHNTQDNLSKHNPTTALYTVFIFIQSSMKLLQLKRC